MQNEYYRRKAQLKEDRCPVCHGLGTENDADLGDIYYHTWQCSTCKGSGIKPTTAKESLTTASGGGINNE